MERFLRATLQDSVLMLANLPCNAIYYFTNVKQETQCER
uniref:Uncharacterized protein n=1 Tax=Arundo donax TaxID=35708 RepID=A0A0A8YUL5_ARUDO